MALTAQVAVDSLRILLGETVAAESRWTDAQLLFYWLEGRREFCKDSLAVRNLYTKTATVGTYRYALEPATIHVHGVTFNGLPLDDMSSNWYEALGGQLPGVSGIPYIYRIIGNALDLFYNPNEAKTIEIDSAIIAGSVTLTGIDAQLTEDQSYAAVDYGAAKALIDDGRADEAELHLGSYRRKVGQWKNIVKPKGPRYTHVTRTSEYL